MDRTDSHDGSVSGGYAAGIAAPSGMASFGANPFSAIAEVTADGRWLAADVRVCAMLGCGRHELMQRPLDRIVHPEDLPAVVRALELMRRGEIARHRSETRLVRADRSVCWADLLIAPAAPSLDRFALALLEVSDRKLLEEATQRRSERLVRLASLLGHDLRSILNVMSLHAQLAKASLGAAEPHVQASLDTIVTTAREAASFMTQLQEYASALTHHADLDRVSLQHIVAQVVADLDQQIRAQHAVVEVGELPRVLSKEAILSRLVFCLVENRLRLCSASEPRIEIATVNGVGRHDAIGLVIRDNGSGMNKHDQQQAFEALFRNRGSERPGTGLEAAFCREYIEDIGGSIWLECWPNQGAQIVVLLPGG